MPPGRRGGDNFSLARGSARRGASGCLPADEEVPEPVHVRDVTARDEPGGVRLLDDRRPDETIAPAEARALVDTGLSGSAIHPDASPARRDGARAAGDLAQRHAGSLTPELH